MDGGEDMDAIEVGVMGEEPRAEDLGGVVFAGDVDDGAEGTGGAVGEWGGGGDVGGDESGEEAFAEAGARDEEGDLAEWDSGVPEPGDFFVGE
jgi:hypothetical protein